MQHRATVAAQDRTGVRKGADRRVVDDPAVIGRSNQRALLARNVSTLTASWRSAYHQRFDIGLEGHNELQLVRYRTGGYYRAHHDAELETVRTVTATAVLHGRSFEGGELAFFGPTGQRKGELEAQVAGGLGFARPGEVIAAGEALYLLETGRRRGQVLDRKGRFLMMF